ncbi:N-acetylmuramoyl-L-alanine amidase [bacterium]|nr:N-acetylmuramoyl-L-alanine amidase [bacterium]
MKTLRLIVSFSIYPCRLLLAENVEKKNSSFPISVIVIDPGHPSEVNSGRAIQNGTTELEMNWEVAERLVKILESNSHLRVLKTREVRDSFMSNKDRSATANKASATIFLRLHCDTGSGSGFTIYYPDRQGKKNGKTGPSQEIIKQSGEAAHFIHRGMCEKLGNCLKDNGIKGDSATFVGGKQGALTGSIFSEVPAVTVEMVFLSNKSDAEFIKCEKGKQSLAQALAQGVFLWVREKEIRK